MRNLFSPEERLPSLIPAESGDMSFGVFQCGARDFPIQKAISPKTKGREEGRAARGGTSLRT